jgi:DNA-binding NarL/FixJ family response regulator
MTTDPRDLQQRAIESAAKAKQSAASHGGTNQGAGSALRAAARTSPGGAITGEGVSDTAELLRLIQMLRQSEAANPTTQSMIVIGEFSVPASRIPETHIAELQGLTRAEAGVIRLLGWGRANSDIAMLLDSNENTVRTHMNNVVKKLELDGMRELITLSGLLFHPLD